MWVVGPALDCDFRVVVVSPPALALGFQSAERFTSSVFIGGPAVEGLSLGLQEPPIHRAALGELLVLWAFSN